MGFGTAHVPKTGMESALRSALLTANLSHIDCAKVYGNEEAIGSALKRIFETSSLTRDKIFVTSKVWNDDHRRVEEACRDSIRRLQLEKLDLYLIHWPVAWRKGTVFCPDNSITLEDTWRQMERLVDLGLTRYIGLSNFDETNLKRVLRICRIRPYCNQLEIHPRLAQTNLVEFNKQNDVKVIAWSPLGKCSYLEYHAGLQRIAQKKHRTVHQVILRWHFQRGISTIPRSTKAAHIASNASIWDFELSDEEMQEIGTLDENKRLTRDWIAVFDTTPYFPYKFPVSMLITLVCRIVFFIVPNRLDLRGNP